MKCRMRAMIILGIVACVSSNGMAVREPARAPGGRRPMAANTPADSGSAEFLGSWRNPVAWTQGIVRIDVHDELGTLKIRVWGRCLPVNCDWGDRAPEPFIALSTRKVAAFRISYGRDHEGIGTDLLLRLEPGPRLRAETYTTFAGNKPSYWAAYFLVPEGKTSPRVK